MIWLEILLYFWIGYLFIQWQDSDGMWDGNPIMLIAWPIGVGLLLLFGAIWVLFLLPTVLGQKIFKQH